MKLLFSIVMIVLLACNNKAETKTDNKDSAAAQKVTDAPVYDRSLVGKWRPVQVDVEKMNETEKKELIDSAVIEFTSSGEIFTIMKENRRAGTYLYSEQDSKLVSRINDREEKFSISWDKDLLKMINEDGSVTLKRQ